MSGDIAESGERSVPIFHRGTRESHRLSWLRFRDRTYRIDLEGARGSIGVAADDLFSALQQLRRLLEEQGLLVAVQGARVDTYPSGMLRDTVGARRVYVLHFGKDMDRSDLVDLFAEADVDLLGTVDQQDEFYKTWRSSVRYGSEG